MEELSNKTLQLNQYRKCIMEAYYQRYRAYPKPEDVELLLRIKQVKGKIR
jgi:hypothetical protein